LRLKNIFSGHRRYFLFPSPGNEAVLIGNFVFPIFHVKIIKAEKRRKTALFCTFSCKDEKKYVISHQNKVHTES
jgi:hypothetical protein